MVQHSRCLVVGLILLRSLVLLMKNKPISCGYGLMLLTSLLLRWLNLVVTTKPVSWALWVHKLSNLVLWLCSSSSLICSTLNRWWIRSKLQENRIAKPNMLISLDSLLQMLRLSVPMWTLTSNVIHGLHAIIGSICIITTPLSLLIIMLWFKMLILHGLMRISINIFLMMVQLLPHILQLM